MTMHVLARTAIRWLGSRPSFTSYQLCLWAPLTLTFPLRERQYLDHRTGYSNCHQQSFSSLLVSCLEPPDPFQYFQHPSHNPLVAPTPGLTEFGAGHGHSSGRRPDAHSSSPSAHRWCRWHCRGSQDWASRLQEEVLRGQRIWHSCTPPPHPPPLFPGIHTPQGL